MISCEKMLMLADLKGCITRFIYVLYLLLVRYNCATFHHCRICETDFRDLVPLCSPHLPSVGSPKRPILNRVEGKLLEK